MKANTLDTARPRWWAAMPPLLLAIALPMVWSEDPLGRETPRLFVFHGGVLLALVLAPLVLPPVTFRKAGCGLFPYLLLGLFLLGVRDTSTLRAATPLLLAATLAVQAGVLNKDRRLILTLCIAITAPAVFLGGCAIREVSLGESGVTTLGNANRVGEYLATVLPACAALYLLARNRFLAAIGLLAILMLIGHTLLCESRGGLLVGVIELALMTAFTACFRKRGLMTTSPLLRMGGLVAGGLVLFLVLLVTPATRPRISHAVERVSQGFSMEYPTNRIRWGVARASFALTSTTPLGTGAGNFQEAFVPFRDPVEHRLSGWGSVVTHAHNQYLHTATEEGVPGGILLVGLLLLCGLFCLNGVRDLEDPLRRAFRYISAVTLMGSALYSLIGTPLLNPTALMNLALIGGVCAAGNPDTPGHRIRWWGSLPFLAGVAALLVFTIPAWQSHLWRTRATEALEGRDTLGLITAWQKAAEATPSDAEVWQHLGRSQKLCGRAEEAIRSLDRALAIRPDFMHCLLARGDILAALGRYLEALEPVTHAVRLQPWNPYPHHLLGKIHLASGNTEDGMKAFRQVVRTDRNAHASPPDQYIPDPKAVDAGRRIVAHLLRQAEAVERQRGKSEAYPLYREVLHLDPLNPTANLKVARTLEREGKKEEAARHRFIGHLEQGKSLIQQALSFLADHRKKSSGVLLEKAIYNLYQATFASPERPDPYYFIAVAHAIRAMPGPPKHDLTQARACLEEARKRGMKRLEDAPDMASYRKWVEPYWTPK